MKTFLVKQTVQYYARVEADSKEQALEIAQTWFVLDRIRATVEDTSETEEDWELVCEIANNG